MISQGIITLNMWVKFAEITLKLTLEYGADAPVMEPWSPRVQPAETSPPPAPVGREGRDLWALPQELEEWLGSSLVSFAFVSGQVQEGRTWVVFSCRSGHGQRGLGRQWASGERDHSSASRNNNPRGPQSLFKVPMWPRKETLAKHQWSGWEYKPKCCSCCVWARRPCCCLKQRCDAPVPSEQSQNQPSAGWPKISSFWFLFWQSASFQSLFPVNFGVNACHVTVLYQSIYGTSSFIYSFIE